MLVVLFGSACLGEEKERYVSLSISSKELLSKNGKIKLTKLNGTHSVGIVCSDEVWQLFLKNKQELRPSIEKPVPKGAELMVGRTGAAGTFCDGVKDCHYLFGVSSTSDLGLLLVLPGVLKKADFRIVVMKSPAQTAL